MSTYKKLNDVITMNYYSAVHSNITLTYNNSPVYFGLEDADENYEGNLTQTTYNINSDYDGCYAVTSNTQGSTVGTALVIMVSISKNDSENERTITYKYNNTPLFKILQSGYTYYYFNKVDITSTNVNFPIYMIVIDDEFTTSLPAINQQNLPPSFPFEGKGPLYFYYSLTHQYDSIKDRMFTYISGGGDILGDNVSPKDLIQIPEMITKYDSTTQEIKRISFSSYKTQIKYTGIFIKSNTAMSFESQALIDFTRSSKYKVE